MADIKLKDAPTLSSSEAADAIIAAVSNAGDTGRTRKSTISTFHQLLQQENPLQFQFEAIELLTSVDYVGAGSFSGTRTTARMLAALNTVAPISLNLQPDGITPYNFDDGFMFFEFYDTTPRTEDNGFEWRNYEADRLIVAPNFYERPLGAVLPGSFRPQFSQTSVSFYRCVKRVSPTTVRVGAVSLGAGSNRGGTLHKMVGYRLKIGLQTP